MKKKAIVFLLCVVMIVSCVAVLSSCKTSNDKKLQVVFIGDSIGEGILGPSPVSEREKYAYYGILGHRNDYLYYNRAISGHQTSQLLEVVQREDYGAQMSNTLLRTSDVIHISIIGNDLLQKDVGEMIMEIMADETAYVDGLLAASMTNITKIIEILRGYNPTAKIIMQTVYNPIYPDSTLIRKPVKDRLTAQGIGSDRYREIGKLLIGRMNNVIFEYAKNHPGEVEVVDVYSAFDKIHEQDNERGKNLIYKDWVHPSNEGHAVIADAVQAKLEEIGLADKKQAIREYKELRAEQIKDYYKDSSLNIKKIRKQINKAKTCEEVTKIYFEATNGVLPEYCFAMEGGK